MHGNELENPILRCYSNCEIAYFYSSICCVSFIVAQHRANINLVESKVPARRFLKVVLERKTCNFRKTCVERILKTQYLRLIELSSLHCCINSSFVNGS